MHCPATLRTALANLLLALLVALTPPTVQAQNLAVTRALAAADDGSGRFPVESNVRSVALPDDWARSRPGEGSPIWYRIAFDAPGVRARDELLGLYVERACSNLEVYLNGRKLHGSGRMNVPISSHCQLPQLVALPAALLEERNNTLDLRLAGHPLAQVASHQRAAGLSVPEIGRYGSVAARHARATLLAVTLPQAVTAALLLLGLLMFALGRWHRRDSHLAYFGALAIGWAVVAARQWWTDIALPNYDAELLLVSFMPLVALAAVQFLLRYAGWRSRPIEVALYAQCFIVPASLLLAGPYRLHQTASSWYVLLALEVLAATVLYLRLTWRARQSGGGGRFWPVALLLLAAAAMVVLELVAQQRGLALEWRALSLAAMPVAFMALGLRLMQQYGHARQSAENSRQTLESRVREATLEMEKNFGQLAELRVEQVTERERKRIAADLHDDLGAKLLTIVHTSESERISTLAREALEEMRLSVRGLTGKAVKLTDALGDWRAEVVARLQQAGVEGEWSSPVEDYPQTLSARAYVQTTRILREAVNNIIKHSGATRCSVRVLIADGDFQLAIQDNGKGIPLELDGRLDRGHGMSSMKHRAKQLHGQCLVESGPGFGTVIRLTLPLERHTTAPLAA